MPAPTPVTTPVADPIVAIDAYPGALHVPPDTALVSVMVDPTQTDVGPAMAGGGGLTVKVAVDEPDEPALYVIVTVPAVSPFTTPLVDEIVAIAGLDDDHVPPGVAQDNVVEPPTHTDMVPVMGATVVVASVMLTGVATFHLSPASSLKLKLTALSTDLMVTVPVPAVGATQGMLTT